MGDSKLCGIINMAEESTNKIFGLSKISNKDTRPFTTKLQVPWFFNNWLSKGFLLFLTVMTFYAVVRIILRGWW